MRTLPFIAALSMSLLSGCIAAHLPGPWVHANSSQAATPVPETAALSAEGEGRERAVTLSLPVRALFTGGDLTPESDALLAILTSEIEGPNPPMFRLHVGDRGAVTLVTCRTPSTLPAEEGGPDRPCARLPRELIETPPQYLTETLNLSEGVSRRWIHPTHIELFVPGSGKARPLANMTVVPRIPRDEAQRSALRRVLSTLPPRATGVLTLLVLPRPVESAGPRGQGGRDASAVYHLLPVPLQEQIASGYFDLVLASGDAGAQWNENISDAIARSSKVWIRRPLAQLVIDGMERPSASQRGTLWTRGTSIRPDLFSQHLGFARVEFYGDMMLPTLVVRRGRTWLEASATAPVGPSATLPARRAVPGMAPCRDCDEPDDLDVDHP